MNSKIIINSAIREYCSRSFYNFFKYFWSEVENCTYEDNWHIKEVCDELQQRFLLFKNNEKDGELLYDLIFNLPPGSSKSLLCTVFFPAWVWLLKPETKFINYSYSYKIAENLAGKSLRLLTCDKYLEIVNYKLTSTAVTNIKNDKYGFIFVTSTGGSVTGIHADIIIGDDPNSPSAIVSEASRQEAKRFVTEILPSRKTNIKRSYSITVQQRLHNEDVTGCLIANKGKLKIIAISAVKDEESFFPNRFPLDFLLQMKEKLGTMSYMAQYQQITQDEQGGIIKKQWIKEQLTENKQLIYFIDSAYGGVSADDNAIIGVYKDGQNLYIHTCEINKYEFPELINWMKLNIPSNSKIYIEGKASGKSIIQTLKQSTSFNIIETQPKGSKIERKHSASPYFESGRIIINSSINNKSTLIEQLIFDNSKHDDIQDVICAAIEQLLKVNKGVYNIR